MVELTNLHLSNFFSHKDSTLNLKELEGLVLLEGVNKSGLYGSNGSGKSSVLEGIIYALTGNTLRNVGVSDMVNRDVGKDTHSHLTLINNGVETDIYRYRKDTKHGDSIVLIEDGKDISSRLNKATQATIDTKLNIPYNVLVNTILLGEGLSSRFTQLSDPDKKALIESTLSLSYDVNTLRDAANSELKKLRLSLAEISGAISSTEAAITNMEASFENPLSQEDLDRCVQERDDLQIKIGLLRSEMEVIANKITVLTQAKKGYEHLYSDYNKAYADYNKVLESINNLNAAPTPHCSLCGQPLSSAGSKEKVLSQYNEQLLQLKQQVTDLYIELSKSPSYDVIKETLTGLHDNYTKVKSEFDATNSSYTNLVAKAADINAKIQASKVSEEQYENCRARLEELNVSKLEGSESLQDYEYIYKLFSPTGLINYILEEALHYINERMKAYTELLFDKSYSFELVKGKLVLKDSTGASYQSLSNGEKRRLDISIQLSLHDYVYNYCGIKVDTLFIDEVLDTLDSVGIENIFDVLRAKISYCGLKRVLVITHNSTLKDKFDTVITVEKGSDGFSTIINNGGN